MKKGGRPASSPFKPDKIDRHLDHVELLEVAWYGHRKDPLSVVVECVQCGVVVAEIWPPSMAQINRAYAGLVEREQMKRAYDKTIERLHRRNVAMSKVLERAQEWFSSADGYGALRAAPGLARAIDKVLKEEK
jgi:hypothetical protein